MAAAAGEKSRRPMVEEGRRAAEELTIEGRRREMVESRQSEMVVKDRQTEMAVVVGGTKPIKMLKEEGTGIERPISGNGNTLPRMITDNFLLPVGAREVDPGVDAAMMTDVANRLEGEAARGRAVDDRTAAVAAGNEAGSAAVGRTAAVAAGGESGIGNDPIIIIMMKDADREIEIGAAGGAAVGRANAGAVGAVAVPGADVADAIGAIRGRGIEGGVVSTITILITPRAAGAGGLGRGVTRGEVADGTTTTGEDGATAARPRCPERLSRAVAVARPARKTDTDPPAMAQGEEVIIGDREGVSLDRTNAGRRNATRAEAAAGEERPVVPIMAPVEEEEDVPAAAPEARLPRRRRNAVDGIEIMAIEIAAAEEVVGNENDM